MRLHVCFFWPPSLALRGLTDLQPEALLKFVKYADRGMDRHAAVILKKLRLELWIHTVLICSDTFSCFLASVESYDSSHTERWLILASMSEQRQGPYCIGIV